ncbi:unnamed protein product [Spirodela intermedia]|uniref:Strictosidine synthase conserved region domain-containing protein n=1 Tax=Spirodela intermedia TaxID=51605 RepID=A0A7I8JRZ6_SPIIN|nr:unnamed protein product [Spirodela intermedia]CAA6672515.1 unnamed protein product [Spirodela intermedia]
MALLIRISFFLVLFSLIVSDRVGPWAAADASSVRNLGNYERIPLTSVSGPESLAFDAGGAGLIPASPTGGCSGGRSTLVGGWSMPFRLETGGDSSEPNPVRRLAVPAVEDVCGRPLGIQFHRQTGKLYVADAYFGLLVVEPGGGAAARLSAGVEGQPFKLTNGVDVDQETGVVYFTDSSTRFQRRSACGGLSQCNAGMDALHRDGGRHGRFMRYDPATKKTAVLLRGLQFPNGVAVSSGGDFVLVAETTKQRVLRFWVKGSKAGSSKRTGGRVLGGRDVDGEECGGSEARRAGEDHAGAAPQKPSGTVSEVQEINGTLWLGSVESSFVAVYSRSSSSPFPSSPASPSSSSLSPTSLRRSL